MRPSSPDGTGIGPDIEQMPKNGRDARNEAFVSVILQGLTPEDLRELEWPEWESPV